MKIQKFDVKTKTHVIQPGDYAIMPVEPGTLTGDGKPVTLIAQRMDTDTQPILLFTEQEMVSVVPE